MKLRKSPLELVDLFQQVVPGPPATQRKMFGFPASFINGNMFMGLFQDEMILRLSEQDRAKLLEVDGAAIFAPMPGRPMKEYISVPPSILEKRDLLEFWVGRSLRYGLSLKAKAKTDKLKRHSQKSSR